MVYEVTEDWLAESTPCWEEMQFSAPFQVNVRTTAVLLQGVCTPVSQEYLAASTTDLSRWEVTEIQHTLQRSLSKGYNNPSRGASRASLAVRPFEGSSRSFRAGSGPQTLQQEGGGFPALPFPPDPWQSLGPHRALQQGGISCESLTAAPVPGRLLPAPALPLRCRPPVPPLSPPRLTPPWWRHRCPRAAPSPPEHAGHAERSVRPPAAAPSGSRESGNTASREYRHGDGGLGVLAPTEPWSGSPRSKLHFLMLHQLLCWLPAAVQYKQVKFLPLLGDTKSCGSITTVCTPK